MTSTAAARPETSHIRWTICALIFFATTINYVDRQVLSLLAKTLETSIGWDANQYADINSAFTAAYAVGMLLAGRLLDRYGTKIGYAFAITLWSVAAMAHAAANSALTFGIARAFLGLGEAANFPACIKVVAEWFPKKERAQATGIFNSGTNVGVLVATVSVPFLTLRWGWQAAFYQHRRNRLHLSPVLDFHVLPAATAFAGVGAGTGLHSDDPPDKALSYPWLRLFPHRETWAFGMGKFLTDGVWWFYLFWFPKYLQDTFKLSLEEIALPTMLVYIGSSVGSIFGGWLSSTLIKSGWAVNRARKTAMLVSGVAVLPVLYAPYSTSLWLTVGLVGLATAAHQAWSANLFTTVSDMFPRLAVGSVVGIGGTLRRDRRRPGPEGHRVRGHLDRQLLPACSCLCGTAYLIALAVFQAFTPRLEPARLD